MSDRRTDAAIEPYQAYQACGYGLRKLAARKSRQEEYLKPWCKSTAEPSMLWKRPPVSAVERDMNRWTNTISVLGSTGGLDAAKQIDAIRERAADVCVAAESHLRVLIKSLPQIRFSEHIPAWFEELVSELDSSKIDQRTIASARNLIRAVTVGEASVEARCELTRDGGIEIAWDVPSQLTWIINRPRMSWPGVNVRAYTRISEDSHALQTRSFFLAHRALVHAAAYLRHER